MHILARHSLAAAPPGSSGPCGRLLSVDEPALLLEGSWQAGEAHPHRWSLDESVDARFAWIDRWATQQAVRLANSSSTAFLNELALRYFLVKLLRVVAFFEEVSAPANGQTWQLYLASDDDAVYAELFEALARRHGVEVLVHWRGNAVLNGAEARQRVTAGSTLREFSWRRWAARAAGLFSPPEPRFASAAPRVMFCGNPRILDPVCAELLARGCRVWWLYEKFAIRAWWKWRGTRANQLVCDEVQCGRRWDSLRSAHPSSASGACNSICRGVLLDGAIASWLSQQAAKTAARQAQWLQCIGHHVRAVQPTVLVLDEDATPFKRAAVAMARQCGVRSLVVQHGAPCGPFGFAPLAADEICVWGESTREQLREWGIADSRIHITGWPGLSACRERTPCRSANRESTSRRPFTERHGGHALHMPAAPQQPLRFLLLATVPPDDRRPDTVTFHLTSRNHAQMIDIACAAVSRFGGARLTIKLHPRTNGTRVFHDFVKRWPQLDVRLVRGGDSASLWSDADCVLSCASTAGIEAALAGAPVVQLLPEGSGDVLPANRWGLIGSARTLDELSRLIDQALARGWCAAPDWRQKVAAQTGPRAAAAIADRLLFLLRFGEQRPQREREPRQNVAASQGRVFVEHR